MNALILVVTLIGTLTVTSYRPVKNQTDASPFYTSTGERVHDGGCAVSRDVLCPDCRVLHRRCDRPYSPLFVHYGDWLYIDGFGYRQVNDVMGDYSTQRINGKRVRILLRRRVDIFVWRYAEERAVDVQHRDVYRIEEQRPLDGSLFEVDAVGTVKGGRP